MSSDVTIFTGGGGISTKEFEVPAFVLAFFEGMMDQEDYDRREATTPLQLTPEILRAIIQFVDALNLLDGVEQQDLDHLDVASTFQLKASVDDQFFGAVEMAKSILEVGNSEYKVLLGIIKESKPLLEYADFFLRGDILDKKASQIYDIGRNYNLKLLWKILGFDVSCEIMRMSELKCVEFKVNPAPLQRMLREFLNWLRHRLPPIVQNGEEMSIKGILPKLLLEFFDTKNMDLIRNLFLSSLQLEDCGVDVESDFEDFLESLEFEEAEVAENAENIHEIAQDLDAKLRQELSTRGQIAFQTINYQSLLGCSLEEAEFDMAEVPIWLPMTPFNCSICFEEDIDPNQGVILKGCYHVFRKHCLTQLITANVRIAAEIIFSGNLADLINVKTETPCPECRAPLRSSEVKMLVPEEVYRFQYEVLSLLPLRKELGISEDFFFCMTPGCRGWAYYSELQSGTFDCNFCQTQNCVACQVVHGAGVDCSGHWDTVEADLLTQFMWDSSEQEMEVVRNEAMKT